MKVHFNRAALADIDEIVTYIAERNPRAADELLARFQYAAKMLERAPLMGSATSREGFRRLVIGRYLMIYETTPDEIIITYVRHGARMPLE